MTVTTPDTITPGGAFPVAMASDIARANGASIEASLDALGKIAPVPLNTKVINAALYRYSATAAVPAGQGANTTNSAAAYVYDESWKALTGEPNVLELTGMTTAPGQYYPVGGYFISAADLAAIGVVPDDANPPLVSIMAAIPKSGLSNTSPLAGPYSGTRIYIDLRYGTNARIEYPSNNSPDDIVFLPGMNGASPNYAGSGDARWSGIPESGFISNANEQRCVRQGVPVPATFNSKPFRGIYVVVVGFSLAAGPTKVRLGRVAVVAGASINQDTVYLNPADNPITASAAATMAAIAVASAKADTALGQVSGKVDSPLPLKTAGAVNAVLNRYSGTNLVPAPHGAGPIVDGTTPAAQFVYDESWFNYAGEPNVMELSHTATAAGIYAPTGGYFITPADLAAIGVVADDTSPPLVSIMASLLSSGLTNQSLTLPQGSNNYAKVWIILRYRGVNGDRRLTYPSNNTTTDVVFINSAVGPVSVYGGSGDTRWSTIPDTGTLNGNERCHARQGVPIPATLNGLALTGILILPVGYSLAAGVSKLRLGRAAIVKGAVMDITKTYPNASDGALSIMQSQIANQGAAVAGNTAAIASKADYSPPLKPATAINAIRGRFNATGSVPVPHGAQSGDVASYVFDEALFNATGEPNALQVEYRSGPSTSVYRPVGAYVVTADDLAAIGVIPDDANPPKISMMMEFLTSGNINQTVAQQQVWFILRYGGPGADKAVAYGRNTDITFNRDSLGYQYAVPAGDTRFSTLRGAAFTDALGKGWKIENVPVPATFNGLALTCILVMGIGYRTAAAAADASRIRLGKSAVIAGAVIDTAKSYLNSDDKSATASSGGVVTTSRVLNITTSDKVGFHGDSYTDSDYSPRGKAWVSKVSMFSDWAVRNFGQSGDRWQDMTFRMRSGALRFGAAIKDSGLVHIVGASETNDRSRSDIVGIIADAKAWAMVARGLGIQPWLATEWVESYGIGYSNALRTAAEQIGVGFMDTRQTSRLFAASQHGDFYGSGHPGVRTNEYIVQGMDEIMGAIGRPRQSMKIYRKRAGVAVPNLDALLFSSHFERASLFKEVEIGQTSLNVADASNAKYDLLADTTGYTLIGYADEYAAMESGSALPIADYALIEGVLDADVKNLTGLSLQISDSAATVYVKSTVAAPYPSNVQYQGFTVADPGVVAGDTYTSSDAVLPGTFTVVGYWAGQIITSPRIAASPRGAGTLTRTGGSGPASIAYTSSQTGFEQLYYTTLGKPPGHWVQLTGTGGLFALTVAQLQGCIDIDKISFLVFKSAAWNLSQPTINYTATRYGKDAYHKQDYRARATGTELLARNDFVAGLTGWTQIGAPVVLSTGDATPLLDPPLNPNTGAQMTSCALVTSTSKVQQAVTFATTYDRDVEIEVRLWPRYYPAKNDGSITADSFDYREVQVELTNPSNGNTVTIKRRVGLWWRDTVFRTVIPAGQTQMNVIVSAVTDPLQLSWVSIRRV